MKEEIKNIFIMIESGKDESLNLKKHFGKFSQKELDKMPDIINVFHKRLSIPKKEVRKSFLLAEECWMKICEQEYEAAEDIAKRALELNPYNELIYSHLAYISNKKNCLDEEIENLIKALEVYPTYVQVFYKLAGAYAKKSMIEESLKNLQLAIEWAEKKDGLGDFRVDAKDDPLFENLKSNEIFKKITQTDGDKLPSPFNKVWELLNISDSPYQAFRMAEKALENSNMKELSITFIIESLERITSDLDEHGDQNLWEYGENKYEKKYFFTQLDHYKAKKNNS